MEPGGSSLYLQDLASGRYPGPDASSPQLLTIDPSLRSIVIISLHLSLCLPNDFFVCISHLSHACYMPHSSRSPWFDHPNNILWSSSLCSLLQPLSTSSLLGPNILLSTLFSDTFTLCSSYSARDKVSYTCKTTGKTVILHILMSVQRGVGNGKGFELSGRKHSPNLISSPFLPKFWIQFLCPLCVLHVLIPLICLS